MSKLSNRSLAAVALLSATAFANPATPPAAGTAPAKGKAGAPKADERVIPEFTPVAADIKPPVKASGRGNKSELAKQLAALEVGQSIGIKNKTKKQISSTLSKINNAAENIVQKTNADGSLVFKNGEAIKDANGAIVSYKQVPETMQIKEFEAHDVNSKEDPHGASVRIWRNR